MGEISRAELTSGMPVLTVRAPWALLFFPGFGNKDIENRDWYTRVRGRVAIHVSRTMTLREYLDAGVFLASIGRQLPSEDAIRPLLGKIIGIVELEDCVKRSPSPCRNAQRIEPVPAIGRLNFWAWQPVLGRPERFAS